MGCRESFRNKAFISNRHRRSCNRQRGGKFSRRRQSLSRPKAPVQNCLPDLTVDFSAEVTSTNKTDMKSHGPEPLSFAMDRQPCTKVNVPSYRFTDVEIATEGSLSVKLISQGQGPVVRGMRGSWNARSWRKAVYRETWSRPLTGRMMNKSSRCGFACLCDIAAKSTIKEERPWSDRTGNINLRGTRLRQWSDEAGRFWCGGSTEQ